MLGIGRSTLYVLMDNGDIGSLNIGASRRIHIDSVNALVERLQESQAQDRTALKSVWTRDKANSLQAGR